MGGIGSGRRWYDGAHETIDAYRTIDARRWQREGLFQPGISFRWQWISRGEVEASIHVASEHGRMVLDYRHRVGGEDWRPLSYPVYLDWTACHLGGKRPWFLCPAKGCGRRVAILYCRGIFACRQCHRLAYPSQRERCADRAIRKADRIRDRLGWLPGVIHGHDRKPKGMHWKKYRHMVRKHDGMVVKALGAMDQRMIALQDEVQGLCARLSIDLHQPGAPPSGRIW